MTSKEITKWTLFSLLLIIVITIISVDVYLIYFRVESVSISNNILEWSGKHPILPLSIGFIFGVLSGHLLWPQDIKKLQF